MNSLFNPFLISGYRGATYFCDREQETKQLIAHIENEVHISLFAFRRLGKTGLIKHVFNHLGGRKKRINIYVDILGTSNLREFTDALATAIYNAIPPSKSIGEKLMQGIQSFRPVLSFDELSGSPSLSFSSQPQAQEEATIKQLLAFLDHQKIKVVFAIDEFQQILNYPEKNIEALLRTQMEQLENITFLFCGSNQHMMHEIFNSAKRPFFGSCTPMYLDAIKTEDYTPFIKATFNDYKQKIEKNAIDFICTWTLRHTFYTQYLCNNLYAKRAKNITLSLTKEVASEILKTHENTFYQYRSLLTKVQWKLLRGIAVEERLTTPHARKFVSSNDLGSPSVVTRALEALVKKEIVFYNNALSKPYYEVYDKFLMRWLQGN